MSRRVSLPGADELFRSTSPLPVPETVALPAPTPATPGPEPGSAESDFDVGTAAEPSEAVRRRPRPAGERRPTGRERHEEKITVYCSPAELIDIERARLVLRGDYGVAADRGRIVREAIAVVLADLEAKGEQSVLVRRLRAR